MLEALQSKKLTIFNQPVGPIWRVICKININEWIVDSFNLPGMGHVPWNNQENCFFHNALSKTSILNIPKYYKEKIQTSKNKAGPCCSSTHLEEQLQYHHQHQNLRCHYHWLAEILHNSKVNKWTWTSGHVIICKNMFI